MKTVLNGCFSAVAASSARLPRCGRMAGIAPLLFAAFFALSGCDEENKTFPPGTVAVVNDEPISLRSVQTLMDGSMGALANPSLPSVAGMRGAYGQATARLIAHALVRQELARRGANVPDRELDEAIAAIRNDYGEEAWQGYAEEESLREEEWRQLVRDNLALDNFVNKILAPSLRVSLEEIRDYYNQHRKEFEMPARAYVCFGAFAQKEELDAWCGGKTERDFSDSPMAQCAVMPLGEIPEQWKGEKLKPLSCGKKAREEGQWRSVALLRREEASLAPLSETYALIENILLEKKKNEAFQRWLEQKLADSRILAPAGLFPQQEDKSEF